MIPVGSILLPVQFDWQQTQGKSGMRGHLIENLGISKKIMSKNDQRDIIKPRVRYKKTARFERLEYDYGNELR